MPSLRSLVVSLEANIAKYSTDMKSAADLTQKTMSTISSAASIAGAALGGLASAFTVQAALDFAKGVVANAAALDDLADATGSSVESLSKLKNQAEIAGKDFATLEGLVLKLGAGMANADDESSNVGRALKKLGVDARDPALALQHVAKALSGYEDGIGKLAIARDLFGKGGPAFLATLKDIAELGEVNATVTAKQAKEAEALEKAFRRLSVESTTLKNAVLSTLVPALNDLIENFRLAREAGEGFFGAILRAGTNLDTLPDQIRRASEAVSEVRKAAAAGANNPLRILPGLVADQKDLDAATAKLKSLIAIRDRGILAAQGDNSDQISRRFLSKPILDYTGGKDGKDVKAAKQAIADYADEIQKLNDQMAKLAGTDGGYAHMIAAQQQISKDLRDGKIITNAAIDAYMAAARALDEQEAAAKALAETWAALEKAVKAAADVQKEIDDAMLKAAQSIKAYNDALDLEHETLGLSDNARRQYITTKQLEIAVTNQDTNAIILLTAQLEKLGRQATDNALVKMAEEAKRAFDAASQFASDFFVDLFNNGSKAFKNLWENFKQLALRALADIAAKQLIVSITGAVGVGAAGAAGASKDVGGIGSLLGGLGSLFGGGGGAFGAAAGAGVSAGVETIKLAATAGLESVGGLGAVLGAASTFVPYAAIAALAIPLIGKLFGGSKAPKEGGFGEAGIDTGRFFSQSQFDDTLNKATAAMVSNFDHLNATLGGTLRAGFAQGIYGRQGKDKEGTTAAFVGGREVFRSTGVSLGKDEASITAALAIESKRAILAALQASDIAPRFAEIIDSVAAASASSADVDRLLGLAQSLQMVEAALGPLNVNLGETGLAAAKAAQQLIDASGGADQFASKVSAFNDTFLTENERLDTAFSSLRDSFVQIGVSMPTSVTAFRDLVESLDLTTQAGRETWSALLDVAPAFASVTNAVQAMITDIYSLQDSIHGVSGGNSALNQLNSAIDAFVGAVPGFAPLLQSLGTEAFAANLANIGKADLANYSPSNIGLIQGVLAAYNALLQAGGGAGGGETGVVYPGQPGYPFETGGGGGTTPDIGQTAEEMVADLLKRFSDLVNQSTGNYGEKLALQIKLATGAIADAGAKGLPAVAALLQATNTKFAASLALFNDLSGRYADQIAEQLVKLTESYNQQAQDLAGNANALDVLNVVFEEQWNDIINGTAAGVDGTLGELQRLQQGILDYVDSLKISADSPLTASQKLEEARRQYEATLAKAQARDPSALQDVSGAFEAYRKLARDFYASSSAYVDIFNAGVAQLTELGNFNFGGTATPTGTTPTIGSMSVEDFRSVIANTGATALVPPVANTDVSAFRAQPTAGTPQTPLADQAVIENVAQTISDAVYDAMMILARSNTEDAAGIKGELERTKSAIVDAITVGLK